MWNYVLCLCSALALASCAALSSSGELRPVTKTKGAGTATVSVQPLDKIQDACAGGEHTLACVPWRTDLDGLTIFFRTPPPSWGISQAELDAMTEIVAHELCHGVHQVVRRVVGALTPYMANPIPNEVMNEIGRWSIDRCHDEDQGIITLPLELRR